MKHTARPQKVYTTQGYFKDGPNLILLSLKVIYRNVWIRLAKSITEEQGKHGIEQRNSVQAGQQAAAQLRLHPGLQTASQEQEKKDPQMVGYWPKIALTVPVVQ